MEIVTWALTTISFFIGYAVGRDKVSRQGIVDVRNAVKKAFDRTPVGPVVRPDARRLDRLRNPEKYAEEEEMIKSLKDIPELNV